MKRAFSKFIVGISVLGCSGFAMATGGEDYDVRRETTRRSSHLVPEEPQTQTFVFQTEIMKMYVSHSVTLSPGNDPEPLCNYIQHNARQIAPYLLSNQNDNYASIRYLFDYGVVKTESSKDKNLLIRAMLQLARLPASQPAQDSYDIWDDERTDLALLFPAQEEENVDFEQPFAGQETEEIPPVSRPFFNSTPHIQGEENMDPSAISQEQIHEEALLSSSESITFQPLPPEDPQKVYSSIPEHSEKNLNQLTPTYSSSPRIAVQVAPLPFDTKNDVSIESPHVDGLVNARFVNITWHLSGSRSAPVNSEIQLQSNTDFQAVFSTAPVGKIHFKTPQSSLEEIGRENFEVTDSLKQDNTDIKTADLLKTELFYDLISQYTGTQFVRLSLPQFKTEMQTHSSGSSHSKRISMSFPHAILVTSSRRTTLSRRKRFSLDSHKRYRLYFKSWRQFHSSNLNTANRNHRRDLFTFIPRAVRAF